MGGYTFVDEKGFDIDGANLPVGNVVLEALMKSDAPDFLARASWACKHCMAATGVPRKALIESLQHGLKWLREHPLWGGEGNWSGSGRTDGDVAMGAIAQHIEALEHSSTKTVEVQDGFMTCDHTD